MSADTIFAGKDEEQIGKTEDSSATIFVVGEVTHTAGVVQLDDQTRLHCCRAVREYYHRTKIINRRRNGAVTDTRITNKVFLVLVSFDRRERERNEAIEQIRCCFASHQYIPEKQILEIREGKLDTEERMKGRFSLEDFAVAIQNNEFPSNVIVYGNEFSFTWKNPFRWKNPLTGSLKRRGIVPEYIGDTNLFFKYVFSSD